MIRHGTFGYLILSLGKLLLLLAYSYCCILAYKDL